MSSHGDHTAGSPGGGHRFHVERRHYLKGEERRQWLPPEPLLESAHIQLGETVVDIGAGTGFWTAPLSQLVGPDGKVIAVDVEPIMLEELRTLVSTQQLRNVEIVQSEEVRIPLATRVADAAILGFVLHEPSDQAAFLREVTRLLKPGGRLLLVDWQKRPTEKGPPVEYRISEQQARSMLAHEGLAVEAVPAPTNDVYALLGRVPQQES